MNTIQKAFVYRLDPTKEQAIKLAKAAGCSRYVFNWGLSLVKTALDSGQIAPTYCDLANMLPDLKKELPWLSEVHSQPLQQSLQNLDCGLKNFFRASENKKRKVGFPKFKKRGRNDSFRYPQGIKCKDGKVWAPKIGWISYTDSRPLEGVIRQATIRREVGNWYISILCEIRKDIVHAPFNPDKAVGIDVGLLSLATLSNGESIENSHFLKNDLKKLKKEQRKLSRSKKGSSNRKKIKERIAKLHFTIRNKRKDYLHKITTMIVQNHDIIIVEDLTVKNMMQNRHLAQAIADVGWRMFFAFLRYKCAWYGKYFVVIPKFFPSSKMCSRCSAVQAMPLHIRIFQCEQCALVLDRDHNAALNIRAAGLSALQAQLANACGGPPMGVPAKQEAAAFKPQ